MQLTGQVVRDYFAAKALVGVMASQWPLSDLGYRMRNDHTVMENNAICAYELADALLLAREAA